MPPQPTLHTERLILRPFHLDDAPAVQRLAGARQVADTTANLPHPYPDGEAERWISTHAPRFAAGEAAIFAISLQPSGELIGAIGLEINRQHARAELGYWIGVPFWNQGYCSEAGRAVLEFAFQALALNRVYAFHLHRNPASGRVLQKLGMRYEGRFRQHMRKGGVFEDVECYGLLREEFGAGSGAKHGPDCPVSTLQEPGRPIG